MLFVRALKDSNVYIGENIIIKVIEVNKEEKKAKINITNTDTEKSFNKILKKFKTFTIGSDVKLSLEDIPYNKTCKLGFNIPEKYSLVRDGNKHIYSTYGKVQ